jgi:general L-amino acid transport system substrate-binding protein
MMSFPFRLSFRSLFDLSFRSEAEESAFLRVPHVSILRRGFDASRHSGAARISVFAFVLAVVCSLLTLPAPAQTLAHIRQSKTLRCGIDIETPEYSTTDDHGPRQAFDAGFCRAVAVAILGSDARVAVTTYPDDFAAMAALRADAVDLLPTLTLDLTHASDTGLAFSPPILYDGVGLLVPLSTHLTRASQLSNKKICFLAETEVEVALRAWFLQQHMKFLPFPFQEEGEMEAAFVTGNCSALAGDRTRLVTTRQAFGPLATRYALLPDQLSDDPLAAASRADDPAFAAIVRWTLEVLLQAEAHGLTQQSILSSFRSSASSSSPSDPSLSSGNNPLLSSLSAPTLSSRSAAEGSASSPASPANSDPTVAILTGQTREIGSRLGLDNAWATQVIAAVGNYGQIYDRTLGSRSPLDLPRAQNRLTTHGGLLFPIPLK